MFRWPWSEKRPRKTSRRPVTGPAFCPFASRSIGWLERPCQLPGGANALLARRSSPLSRTSELLLHHGVLLAPLSGVTVPGAHPSWVNPHVRPGEDRIDQRKHLAYLTRVVGPTVGGCEGRTRPLPGLLLPGKGFGSPAMGDSAWWAAALAAQCVPRGRQGSATRAPRDPGSSRSSIDPRGLVARQSNVSASPIVTHPRRRRSLHLWSGSHYPVFIA